MLKNKLMLLCNTFFTSVSIIIFSSCIINKSFNVFILCFLITYEILCNICLSLLAVTLINEQIAIENNKYNMLYQNKFSKYSTNIAIIIMLALFVIKNILLINNYNVTLLFLSILLLTASIFTVVSIKVNNIYLNENSLYLPKYREHINFSEIININVTSSPINVNKVELITTNKKYIFNTSKNIADEIKNVISI